MSKDYTFHLQKYSEGEFSLRFQYSFKQTDKLPETVVLVMDGVINTFCVVFLFQAISESDGHHFMILFKDGLKFRGMYVHNLENDQVNTCSFVDPGYPFEDCCSFEVKSYLNDVLFTAVQNLWNRTSCYHKQND